MSQRPSFFRRTLLIDKNLQLTVMFYSVYIAVVWATFTFIASSLWSQVTPEVSPEKALQVKLVIGSAGAFAFICSIYVFLMFTNRIAGPIYRLKKEMQNVIDGGSPQPIKLRKDDMMIDLIELYNSMVDRVGDRDHVQKD